MTSTPALNLPPLSDPVLPGEQGGGSASDAAVEPGRRPSGAPAAIKINPPRRHATAPGAGGCRAGSLGRRRCVPAQHRRHTVHAPPELLQRQEVSGVRHEARQLVAEMFANQTEALSDNDSRSDSRRLEATGQLEEHVCRRQQSAVHSSGSLSIEEGNGANPAERVRAALPAHRRTQTGVGL